MSAGAIIFGEIARTSLKKERTAAFALFMSTRQVGLVIGEQSGDVVKGGGDAIFCFVLLGDGYDQLCFQA